MNCINEFCTLHNFCKMKNSIQESLTSVRNQIFSKILIFKFEKLEKFKDDLKKSSEFKICTNSYKTNIHMKNGELLEHLKMF